MKGLRGGTLMGEGAPLCLISRTKLSVLTKKRNKTNSARVQFTLYSCTLFLRGGKSVFVTCLFQSELVYFMTLCPWDYAAFIFLLLNKT